VPIIQRESPVVSSSESVAGIVSPTAGATFQAEAIGAAALPSDASRTVLLSLIGAVCGVLIPFIVYFGVQPFEWNFGDAAETTAVSQNIDLDIQRLQKLAAIAALTQKEYEMNTVSRAEAEASAEAMTLAALDAILDKNRQQLGEAKAQMVALLVGLHLAHEKSPKQVQARFAAAIDALEKKNSPEVLKTLRLSAQAIEGVPDGTPAEKYLSQALDNNL
jgi:hypothetical protein